MRQVVIGSKENFELLNKKIARIFGKSMGVDENRIRWLKFTTFDDQESFMSKYSESVPSTRALRA